MSERRSLGMIDVTDHVDLLRGSSRLISIFPEVQRGISTTKLMTEGFDSSG